MKNNIKTLLVLLLSLTMIFSFSACGKQEQEEPDTSEPEITDDISDFEEEDDYVAQHYDEEDEDANLEKVAKPEDDFIGTWTTDSENGKMYYYNLELNIQKGGKWTGYIIDEDVEGTWTKTDTGVLLTCDLVDFDLAYTSSGTLILQEDIDGEIVTTVLKKK